MPHTTSACYLKPTLRFFTPSLSNSQNSSPHLQLREAEQQVLPIRMQELQERLSALQSKESEYQARYSELSRATAVQ